jgi:hypothetical protein
MVGPCPKSGRGVPVLQLLPPVPLGEAASAGAFEFGAEEAFHELPRRGHEAVVLLPVLGRLSLQTVEEDIVRGIAVVAQRLVFPMDIALIEFLQEPGCEITDSPRFGGFGAHGAFARVMRSM